MNEMSMARSFPIIDEPGRKFIRKTLTESENPWQSIDSLRNELGFRSERCDAALKFLDILNCSRSQVYSDILDSLKARLEAKIDKMPHDKKISMLNETIKYLPIAELKSIPIRIIKSLDPIPEKVLRYLSRENYLNDFSLSVRQAAWKLHPDYFRVYLTNNYFPSDLSVDRDYFRSKVGEICECIGGSETLFGAFANYCCQMARKNGSQIFLSFIGLTLQELQATGRRIQSVGRLHDLCSLVESCISTKSLSEKKLVDVFEHLRSLVVAQGVSLERELLELSKAFPDDDSLIGLLPKGSSTTTSGKAMIENALSETPPHIKQKQEESTKSALKRIRNHENEPEEHHSHKDDSRPKRSKRDPTRVDYNKLIRNVRFEPNFLQRYLIDCWTTLREADKDDVFLNPVTDKIAKNYSQIIPTPMDLTTIRKKLDSSSYHYLADFDNDLVLMFDNCQRYNCGDDHFRKLAKRLLGQWQKKLLVVAEDIHTDAVDQQLVSNELRDVGLEVEGSLRQLSGKKLKEVAATLLEYMSSCDPAGTFAVKVTDDIAPGYSVEIAHPMDTSTMRSKLQNQAYQSFDQFEKDMLLIFDNCVRYNGEHSDLGPSALALKATWCRERSKLLDSMEQKFRQENPFKCTVSAIADNKEGTTADSALTSELPPSAHASNALETDKSVAAAAISMDASWSEKEKLFHILEHSWMFLTNHDSSGYFASANVHPNFMAQTLKPIDLSVIKVKIDRKKYRKYEEFKTDVETMIISCLNFYKGASAYHKNATTLEQWWKAQDSYNREIIYAPKEVGPMHQEPPQPAESEKEPSTIASPVAKLEINSLKPADEKKTVDSTEALPVTLSNEASGVPTRLAVGALSGDGGHAIAGDSSSAKPTRTASAVNQELNPVAERRKQRADLLKTLVPSSRDAVARIRSAVSSSDRNSIISLIKQEDGHSLLFPQLPTVVADDKLQWALAMLRDNRFQQLLLQFLCFRLENLSKNDASKDDAIKLSTKAAGLALATMHRASKFSVLPKEDICIRLALQLLQLSFPNLLESEHEDQRNMVLYECNDTLLRLVLPLVLLHHQRQSDVADMATDGAAEDGEELEEEQEANQRDFMAECISAVSAAGNSYFPFDAKAVLDFVAAIDGGCQVK